MNLYEKKAFRTDLADENEAFFRQKSGNKTDGVLITCENCDGFCVTSTEITTGVGEKICGKPKGKYVCIEVGKIWQSDKARFCSACENVAVQIKKFVPQNGSCMLAALGNRLVTADAVGSYTADNFIVTRHIKNALGKAFCDMNLRETSCVVPGVLGSTGIESARLIRGAVGEVKPDFVIAVDALASGRLERLATTVQISGSGIVPGSGVNNSRQELCEKTLGVPVISVGVPTVVDAFTMAMGVLHRSGAECDEATLSKLHLAECDNFFVTPKETDHIVKDISKLVGYSLNLALHDGISFDEIDELIT